MASDTSTQQERLAEGEHAWREARRVRASDQLLRQVSGELRVWETARRIRAVLDLDRVRVERASL